MDTTRKVTVITGASQGIGAGLVRGFLDRGDYIVANSRSIQPDASSAVLSVAGDISDPAVADRVIAEAVARFGRVDTLINNAGIFVAKPFTEYTAADFARVMSVNLAGFFYVSQQAVRQMLKQGGGHIVNVTTTLVRQPIKAGHSRDGSLTKGGLDAVTRSLAIEYADKGIRVNAVAPGIIKTPMHAPETLAFLASLHPLGRMGRSRKWSRQCSYLESAGS